MTSLYFLRHGLADRDEWSGDDFHRPLTARGKEQIAREAQTIAQMELGLSKILTSPLLRAYQTAQIVADALGMQDRLTAEDRLAPGFDATGLAEILRDHPDCADLMLVGHEPDFSDTIGALIGGGRIVCKKGSLARVDVPDAGSLSGSLVWLVPPRLLAS